MVDVLRAYGRWLRRRLSLLGPSFLAAVAVILRLALDHRTSPWLKIVSLSLALLIVALLGFLLVETMLCDRLHRGPGRELGRVLRRQLVSYRGVALACLLLLGVIVLVPDLFPIPSPFSPDVRGPRDEGWNLSMAAVDRFEQVPPDKLPGVATPEQRPAAVEPASPPAAPTLPPTPEPRALPFIPDLPVRLELGQSEFEVPVPTDLPRSLRDTAQAAEPREDEDGQPRFRPDESGLLRMGSDRVNLPVKFRRGVMDENDLDGRPPAEFHLEGVLLSGEGFRRSGGGLFVADLPLGRTDSVRATYMALFLREYDRPADQATSEVWHRFMLEYVHRFAGHTRNAPFDLSLSIGLGLDRFSLPERQDALNEKARIGPVVGIDLALWQEGSVGLLLHASQSAPVNLTGATSAVTDLSAMIRWDLTEQLSIQVGYRFLLVHLRDYPDSFRTEHREDELDATLSGPLIGLEFRF